MLSREQITDMRKDLAELTAAIKEADRELKRQEAKPYDIYKRVNNLPLVMPGGCGDGSVTHERVLSCKARREEWRLLLALSKLVVGSRVYGERGESRYNGYFDSQDTYCNRLADMSEAQLSAIADFMEDAIELYNEHFKRNHPFALVAFKDQYEPICVPVIAES